MKATAYKRINVTLPSSTVELLESVAGKGERSGFVDEAIRTAVSKRKRTTLREQLKEGAIVNAERDLAICREWSEIEDDLWP